MLLGFLQLVFALLLVYLIYKAIQKWDLLTGSATETLILYSVLITAVLWLMLWLIKTALKSEMGGFDNPLELFRQSTVTPAATPAATTAATTAATPAATPLTTSLAQLFPGKRKKFKIVVTKIIDEEKTKMTKPLAEEVARLEKVVNESNGKLTLLDPDSKLFAANKAKLENTLKRSLSEYSTAKRRLARAETSGPTPGTIIKRLLEEIKKHGNVDDRTTKEVSFLLGKMANKGETNIEGVQFVVNTIVDAMHEGTGLEEHDDKNRTDKKGWLYRWGNVASDKEAKARFAPFTPDQFRRFKYRLDKHIGSVQEFSNKKRVLAGLLYVYYKDHPDAATTPFDVRYKGAI